MFQSDDFNDQTTASTQKLDKFFADTIRMLILSARIISIQGWPMVRLIFANKFVLNI